MPWGFLWGESQKSSRTDYSSSRNNDSDGDDSTDTGSDVSSSEYDTGTDADSRAIDDDGSSAIETPRFPDIYQMWANMNVNTDSSVPSSEYEDRWDTGEMDPVLMEAAQNISNAWFQVSLCFAVCPIPRNSIALGDMFHSLFATTRTRTGLIELQISVFSEFHTQSECLPACFCIFGVVALS